MRRLDGVDRSKKRRLGFVWFLRRFGSGAWMVVLECFHPVFFFFFFLWIRRGIWALVLRSPVWWGCFPAGVWKSFSAWFGFLSHDEVLENLCEKAAKEAGNLGEREAVCKARMIGIYIYIDGAWVRTASPTHYKYGIMSVKENVKKEPEAAGPWNGWATRWPITSFPRAILAPATHLRWRFWRASVRRKVPYKRAISRPLVSLGLWNEAKAVLVLARKQDKMDCWQVCIPVKIYWYTHTSISF